MCVFSQYRKEEHFREILFDNNNEQPHTKNNNNNNNKTKQKQQHKRNNIKIRFSYFRLLFELSEFQEEEEQQQQKCL